MAGLRHQLRADVGLNRFECSTPLLLRRAFVSFSLSETVGIEISNCASSEITGSKPNDKFDEIKNRNELTKEVNSEDEQAF
jgi:hypothetical protein